MSAPEKPTVIDSDVLRHRIALSMAMDEQVIEALAVAASMLRDVDNSRAADFDSAIRTHRIAIMKQRAIFGAAGIEV